MKRQGTPGVQEEVRTRSGKLMRGPSPLGPSLRLCCRQPFMGVKREDVSLDRLPGSQRTASELSPGRMTRLAPSAGRDEVFGKHRCASNTRARSDQDLSDELPTVSDSSTSQVTNTWLSSGGSNAYTGCRALKREAKQKLSGAGNRTVVSPPVYTQARPQFSERGLVRYYSFIGTLS